MIDDDANKPRATRSERVRRASQQRRALQKEELRQAILQAAGDLFLQQGYEAFSLRQVAEYLGYSPTTIYLYFESKDALLFAVADDAYRLFCDAELQAFMSTDEPLERIIATGRAYVDFGLTHPTAYKLIFAQRTDFLMGHLEGATQPRIESFKVSEQAIYLAIEAGAIRQGNPTVMFNALWSAMHGLVMLALTMPEFNTTLTERVREELLDILLNGILPR